MRAQEHAALLLMHSEGDPSVPFQTGGSAVCSGLATKGAPEAIADLCHPGPEQRASLARDVLVLALWGLRVLGVARGAARVGALPDEHRARSLELVGLLGFEDPLRPTVPAAVADCQAAGCAS